MARGASIAASGNAGGIGLKTTVLPFILRGVNLLGIDSNLCPYQRRLQAWSRLAQHLPADVLSLTTYQEAGLEEILALSQDILKGKIKGRVLVKLT